MVPGYHDVPESGAVFQTGEMMTKIMNFWGRLFSENPMMEMFSPRFLEGSQGNFLQKLNDLNILTQTINP